MPVSFNDIEDSNKYRELGKKAFQKALESRAAKSKEQELIPYANEAITEATKAGIIAGNRAALSDTLGSGALVGNNATQQQQEVSGLGSPIDKNIFDEASRIVDEFDNAEMNGYDPQEIAKAFNSLEPNLRVAVEKVKELKNRYTKPQQIQPSGSNVIARPEPSDITLSAKNILKSIQ